MFLLEEFKNLAKGEVLLNESLAKYTTLKIGGAADFFFKPETKDDVIQAIAYVETIPMNYMIIGNGSNSLIDDEGVRGMVLYLKRSLRTYTIEKGGVYVEAGADLPSVALKITKEGYGGLENLCGIPGTVGGAIVMNAGAYQREIFDLVEWVEVLRNGKLLKLKKADIKYDYRKTDLQQDIVLSCFLKLKKLSPEETAEALEKRENWMKHRRDTQPLLEPNSGSVFKNHVAENGEKKYAAQMIEACGLKGYIQGGAKISEKHANFIINLGYATSKDILFLTYFIKKNVYEKFGILLELEVKLIGCKEIEFKPNG